MSTRRLSPQSLFDVDAVREIGRREGLRDEQLQAVWRASVRGGAQTLKRVDGVQEHVLDVLSRECAVATSSVTIAEPAQNGKGFKLVVRLQDGNLVETVAIVHESRATTGLQGRITVCVSSQVGCKMGCTFCATGTMGFKANLTAGEICEQVWHVERRAPGFGVHWRVTNVVFMGMGEPLNNYQAVCGALRGLRELWELSPSRITVSTVGVVNKMRTLAADAPGISLALSLHAATQETRLKLVPSSAAYSVEKLMSAVDDYTAAANRSVMIEFILIANLNDTLAEAMGA